MDWKTIVNEKLHGERKVHTESVVFTAIRLATRYGANVETCTIAAWMHDLCKYDDINEQREYATKFDPMFASAPKPVLHGPCCAQKYADLITPEIAEAIAYHTIGKYHMSKEAQIVFLADYISDDRENESSKRVRKVAFDSLEKAIIMVIDETESYLASQGFSLLDETIKFKEGLYE